ncbi:MAG: cytochrome P450 [Novosphingobium sp.]|nr:cytochrome P450 [Novosphingobium sp.]
MSVAIKDRPMVEFNHQSPEFARNWRAKVAEIHRIGPVVWTNAHGGHWIIADRELVEQAAQDWETFSSLNVVDGSPGAPRGILIPPLEQPLTLNEQDPPESTERRMLEAKFFAPAYLRKWAEYAEKYLDQAIDEAIAKGGGEFVHDIGLRVPAKTTLTLVGVDPDDWESIAMPAHKITRVPATSPDYPYDELARIHQKLVDLILERGERPRDDMASSLAKATIGGQPLDPQIGAGMLLTLATGGFDTATAMLSHSFIWLADHKDQWPPLLEDDGKLVYAINELFRAYPSNVGTARNVTRDVEFGGQLLRKGDRVMLCWSAANYDPQVFPDPEQIRLDRPNSHRHLTFGAGGHRCLGSPLARIEIKAVFKAIMTRMPNYRVDKASVEYFENIGNVNGIARLPFTVD